MPKIKSTILIVDDNPENLSLFSRIFETLNFKIHSSGNSKHAIDLCNSIEFDLILMDIRMPLDGFKTYGRISKTTKNNRTPVIYMAEKTDFVNITKAFNSGCQDVITKPFQIDEILSKISVHATLLSQQKQLRELIEAKDKFNLILAHDLKSPFSGLMGLSELLADNTRSFDTDKIESLANMINNSIKSTYNLLEDLLLWAKAQSGSLPFKPKTLNLKTICSSTFKTLLPLSDAKGIELGYSGSKSLKVFADADMLKMILRNLISNSIKFSNTRDTIEISAEKVNASILIKVIDNGIGMEPEAFSRLFVLSEVISSRGTAGEKGSGLGLLLCKQFVEKHGGEIWAESWVGKGSVFYFTLPQTAED